VSYVNDKLREDVRTVGWHILGIEGDATTPHVVHTVGLHQSFGHPEIVMVGLKVPTLMQMVGDLGSRIANGAKFDPSHELGDVLEGFPVAFERVLRIAYERFLPAAAEFYAERPFDALQCLWPDKQRRFPRDRDFDAACATVQPRLGDSKWTPIYASWVFEDSYVLACFATRLVVEGTKPITLVAHDEDGAWQFLCGTTNRSEDGRLIALREAVNIDPTVSELADLPRGWEASRLAPGEAWIRTRSEGQVGDD